jgi:3-methyladenine DNA glycosylase/8-oxoguanine DNA glycosylase
MKSNPIQKPGNRGGRRPGSGRKKGSPNKATFELKQAAAEHGQEVLDALMRIIRDQETPANTIVAACRELLDRGYGKPTQYVEENVTNSMTPDVLKRLETDMLERMAKARERQRQVLIERGFIDKDGNKLRD